MTGFVVQGHILHSKERFTCDQFSFSLESNTWSCMPCPSLSYRDALWILIILLVVASKLFSLLIILEFEYHRIPNIFSLKEINTVTQISILHALYAPENDLILILVVNREKRTQENSDWSSTSGWGLVFLSSIILTTESCYIPITSSLWWPSSSTISVWITKCA